MWKLMHKNPNLPRIIPGELDHMYVYMYFVDSKVCVFMGEQERCTVRGKESILSYSGTEVW